MRLLTVFHKTILELRRDLVLLGLSLIFAPLFVYLYYLFFPGGSTSYTILVVNQDQPVQTASGERFAAAESAVQEIDRVAYANGLPMLRSRLVQSRAEAELLLRNREGVTFVQFPEEFSAAVLAAKLGDEQASTRLIFGGDLTNPYYMLGAILSTSAIDGYVQEAAGRQPLVKFIEEPFGASGARTEFETYVPGIMVFAVILMIFLAAMTVAHEVEAGTLRRLRMSPLNAFELLGGISLALVVVAVASVILTFLAAVALGFHSQGPLWVAVLVGSVTSLSIIGVGMLVASFSRTVSQAFVIANFPLGLFMFFSGAAFPLPRTVWFSLAGHSVSPYDILPPTHAVIALNKVLTLGAGLEDVIYELVALLVLSVVYFLAGAIVFHRLHMT